MEIEVGVSVRGVDHSVVSIREPTLETFTGVLTDVYARMGCEACGREVRVRVRDKDAVRVLYAEDPEASVEEVAAELWERIGSSGAKRGVAGAL